MEEEKEREEESAAPLTGLTPAIALSDLLAKAAPTNFGSGCPDTAKSARVLAGTRPPTVSMHCIEPLSPPELDTADAGESLCVEPSLLCACTQLHPIPIRTLM